MKKTTLLLFLALGVVLTALPGCSKEKRDLENEKPDNTQIGALVLSGLNVGVANYAEEMTTSGNTNDGTRGGITETTPAPDNYIVRITNQKTSEEVAQYTCAEIRDLPDGKLAIYPGIYVISAESPNYASYVENGANAEWETPVYYGSVTKTVLPKADTQVADLVCVLGNIKTTVALTADLCNLFMSDAEAQSLGKQKLQVSLSIGSDELVFDREKAASGAAGYFKAAAAKSTIKVKLTGMYNKSAADEAPEYILIEWTQDVPDCAAGQWRKLSIGILNANEGNAQFELTVQNWVYDDKIDVDMVGLYTSAFVEEIIKEGEVSDADAPVVTLAGGAIEDGYAIDASMYDEDLEKWSQNLKVVFTPEGSASVASVGVEVDSDNAALLAALETAGYADHKIGIWPTNAASAYLTLRQEASAVSATLKDTGMSAIFGYAGVHTIKYIAADSQGRTSYTELVITVTNTPAEPGPKIVWTNLTGTKIYDFSQRYNHNEVEALITVTTESAFTDFSVDIISTSVLSPEELVSVGLSSHLDLINPGEYETGLNALGFPTGDDVTSKKTLEINITGFMPLLSILAGTGSTGDCDFRLSVTDASGTTVKTLQLNVVQ